MTYRDKWGSRGTGDYTHAYAPLHAASGSLSSGLRLLVEATEAAPVFQALFYLGDDFRVVGDSPMTEHHVWFVWICNLARPWRVLTMKLISPNQKETNHHKSRLPCGMPGFEGLGENACSERKKRYSGLRYTHSGFGLSSTWRK